MDSPQTQNSPLHWGSYSCLYGPLTAGEIQVVEEAIFERKLGRFKQARQIWNNKLPLPHTVPVLAIEKAELEARQGRHGLRLDILETALASQEGWRETPSEQEINLLTILTAAAKLEANGSLRPALLQARKLRGFLQGRPLKEWSLTELACATEYIKIMKKCKRYSSWLDLKNDPLFPESSDGSSWGGIHPLQLVLMEANDMYRCLSLLSAEQELLNKKADLCHLFEFVNICESKLPTSHDQILLVLIDARLLLAQNLLELKRQEEFSFQLQQIESAMNNLPWIQQSDSPARWFRILQVYSEASPNMENLSAWLDLASTMRENQGTLQETEVLIEIQMILNGVDQIERDSAWDFLNAANLNRFDELHSGLGGNALFISHALSRFGITDRSIKNAGEYLHRLEQLESRFPAFDVPFHRLFMYQPASDAAQKLGNKELNKNPSEWPLDFFITVLEWIKLDFEKGSLSASDVARLLLLDQTNILHQEIATDFYTAKLGPDSSRELANRMYGENVPVDADLWELSVGRYEKWLWDSPSEVERSLRHTILLDMHKARDMKLLYHHAQINRNLSDLSNQDLVLDMHLWRIAERSRMAELRKNVDGNAVGVSQTNILLDAWHLMSLKGNLANSVKAVQDRIVKDDDLLEVQTWMEQALLKFPTHLKDYRLITLSTIAQTMKRRYTLFGTIPADAALDVYARYDEAYMEQRRERSILRGSSNLVARAQFITHWTHVDHYIDAMSLCVEALGPARLRGQALELFNQVQSRNPGPAPAPQRSNDSLIRELIEWAQKRKARSVTEVLGAEIIIPQSILAALGDDDHAIGLLRKEADLQTKLNSNPSDPIKISEQLDHIRKEARKCPSLEKIMDIRDGGAITSTQLQAISQELGPRVIMVDYIYLPSTSTGLSSEILPMVYKEGILQSSNWVTPDLNYANLKNWVQTVMEETEPLSTEEAGEYLAMLSPLISTAVEASEPGDTILLCPTGILFSIPFHAILINDQPLIKRNPVVYTQSLSILRICRLSTTSVNANEPASPLAVQALSDTESSLPSAPTMAFASKIGARLLAGADLTKASFLEAITRSSWIHFYGHVSFDESKPLDHYLAIRGTEVERVTASELFDIRLRSGVHVNLIGCRSGRSEVRNNDDQFGLSTALLYAGAGSILSALWAIKKEDAHDFQEAFYEEVLVQCEEGRGDEVDAERVLDLAKVLRKAVLRVMVDENGKGRAPYHWAAFMLQGSWDALPIRSLCKN